MQGQGYMVEVISVPNKGPIIFDRLLKMCVMVEHNAFTALLLRFLEQAQNT